MTRVWLCVALSLCIVAAARAAEVTTPRTILIDPAVLVANKAKLAREDKSLQPALRELVRRADDALTTQPASVMDKPKAGASGDKHDYYSFGPYWWPDPAKADGLPYIRRDGDHNNEQMKLGDSPRFKTLQTSVHTLALAWWYTGEEKYPRYAGRLLRVWFLDPATRMNPNFNQAQAIPGINDGRGIGLIEFHGMASFIDALALLDGAPGWSADDAKAMHQWLADYHQWMMTSKLAQDEREAKNNHGSWVDAQETALDLYLGDTEAARKRCATFGERRIATQVEPDGRQPLELARESAFGYSMYNLEAHMTMATLADHVGVDLWHYKTADGRSMKAAFDYLLPFAAGEKEWPHKHIGPVADRDFTFLLCDAQKAWGGYDKYLQPPLRPDASQMRLTIAAK